MPDSQGHTRKRAHQQGLHHPHMHTWYKSDPAVEAGVGPKSEGGSPEGGEGSGGTTCTSPAQQVTRAQEHHTGSTQADVAPLTTTREYQASHTHTLRTQERVVNDS